MRVINLPSESLHALFCRERVVQENYIRTKVFMHGKDHWFAVSYANNYSVKGQNQQQEACETSCTSQII